MPQDFDSDELLARYHLGELSPGERDAVEDRYFADVAFHERVMAAEEELIDSYVRGELSTEQRKHFESWFLKSDDRREKLKFAKTLSRYRPAPGPTAIRSVLEALQFFGSTERKRPLFDTAYLRALKQRDPDAENDLINHFARPVRLKLQARLRSAELVEVASPLVFDRALAELRSGVREDPVSLRGFVHAVCDEVALDVLESHYSGQKYDTALEGSIPIPPDTMRQLETLNRKHWARRFLRDSMEAQFRKKDRELLGRVLLSREDKELVCREFGVDHSYLRDLVHKVRLLAKRDLLVIKAETRAANARLADMETKARARLAELLADVEERPAPKHPGTDRVK
jgi:hypothetical protein